VRFRSRGDTEVVLAALARWGADGLRRFNGMFALAFYDGHARRLLLARDHAGMKPLYYLRAPHGVAFASQYDQILHHPWSATSARSDDGLGLYLRLGYIPAPYALLRDTHQLSASTWLEIDSDGRERSGQFFVYPRNQEPDLSGAAADEAVRAAIDAAVHRHLAADVPVGTFLSGGIDSPLIAATARAVADRPICAFTLGTGGDLHDESADAAIYAHAMGIEHVIEHLTPERALTMVDDVVSACSEPFADYSLFPTLCVSRLARERVAVSLSGDGGDELFWGYVGRCSALLRRLDPGARTEGRPYGAGAIVGRRRGPAWRLAEHDRRAAPAQSP
jgi:asparagine synthase (glutamine-hydrolysing)